MLKANDVLNALRVQWELKDDILCHREPSLSPRLSVNKSQQGELTLPQGLEQNSPTRGTQGPWTSEDVSARVSENLSEE